MKPVPFDQFLELCTQDLAQPEGSSMTPGSDESAAQVFTMASEDIGSSLLQELLETGSVTVVIGGKSYVAVLSFQEAG